MPTSYPHQISKILDIIICRDPQSILDIGVGFGKYGMLSREYLDLWDGNDGAYQDFRHRIDGVEAFEDYITPLHRYVYNNIFIGDALTVLDGLTERYDLMILVDVLEHFAKVDGHALLRKMLGLSPFILVSVPRYPVSQQEAFGNQYEAHRARWSRSELATLPSAFFVRDAANFIVCAGQRDVVRDVKWKLLASKARRVAASIPLATPIFRRLEYLARKEP